jgi:hypothetical protein
MTLWSAARRALSALAPRANGHHADVSGGVYALTVLTPIVHGREDALRARLEQLPERLFERIPATHFARFVLVDRLPDGSPGANGDELRSAHLLFSSTFDAPLGPYVDALRTELATEAERIWGCCAGSPGTADPSAFKRYLRHHQLHTGLFFNSYPGATVERVRASLRRRAALQSFVVRAARLEPTRLQAAFLEELSDRERAAV